MIMKKFEILWDLSKWDTETQSEKMLLQNGAYRLAWCRVDTSCQSVKDPMISVSTKKQNGVKWGVSVYMGTRSLLLPQRHSQWWDLAFLG